MGTTEVNDVETDTIAAISTPMGEGGIAIIRVSGSEAIPLVDRIFKGKQPLLSVNSHTIHYGFLTEPVTNQKIEEVMVTVLKQPKTYTRENIVEVNCHGGILSSQRVLQLIVDQGARLAEPGEFTKRAFLNGRLDLTQAEAVIDLIRSKTNKAINVALKQVDGRLSHKIIDLRQQLLEVLAHIEVSIDYPEHDVEDLSHQFLTETCKKVLEQIDQLLQTAAQGKILREGIKTAIVGRPNVGKSSLLNALAHENKAIVTEIPGTTRDIVEEYVNVRGIPLQLIDTAGIRETTDLVEKLGVERSRKVLQEADLILLVANIAEEWLEEDDVMLELVKGMKTILILNKTDLPNAIEPKTIQEKNPDMRIIATSILRDQGIEDLEQAIADLYLSGQVDQDDLTYVSNTRHIHLLHDARDAISEALEGFICGLPVDIVQIDVHRSWQSLGEIIGEKVSDSLIDQLFSQFCLGK